MLHFPHRAGNYVLFAELGVGAVGTAYIGRPVGQGRGWRPVVVKLLASHLSQRADVVRVFLDEQRSAALLQHPRIAAVLEVGVMPEGAYFLATEYVHGVPLREVLRTPQAQLTPAQAVHIAMQACDALHYAHERLDVMGRPLHIVHGQLSPDVVFVGFDGNVRLTEFGLLRTREAATSTIPTLLQRRTPFLAPELRAQMPLRTAPQIDRRADVFSVGALLWEMLTGESLVPLEEDRTPPRPSQLRPVDPRLEAVVLRAMARSPADRYPTAQALRLALSEAQAALGAEGSLAMGLARSLTVAFRERIIAFQEQLDLWRKYEDDALPEGAEAPRRPSDAPATRRSGAPSGSLPGAGPALMTPSGHGPLGSTPGSRPGSGSSSATPLPPLTPQPAPAMPGSALRSRLFLALLLVAIAGILVGGVALVLRPRPLAEGAVLLVDSVPRGADIHLDGRPAGVTPYRISGLSAPTVRVEVRKAGFRPWVGEVRLQAGHTSSIDAELEPEPRRP
ncbi:MAG: protein kinase [Myxococcales bacterium]|nr:protein kinase [Myxococcota bacterium]MDW8283399.1 protein kinase [Myxococcales bacterium]